MGQLTHVTNPGMGEVSFLTLLKILKYPITISHDYVIMVVFAFLVSLMIIFVFKNHLTEKDNGSFYLLCGIVMFLGTVVIGFALSAIFRPIIIERYFLPCFGVFWFVSSICISKLKSRKLLLAVLCLILLVGAVNVDLEFEKIKDYHEETLESYEIIDEINNDQSIVIYDGINKHARFNSYLNKVYNSSIISVADIVNGSDEFENDLNQNKTVYFISARDNLLNEKDYNCTRVAVIKPAGIYEVER